MALSTGTIETAKLASAGNIFVGLWLVLAPWFYDHGIQQAFWNDMIIGVAVLVIAAIRFWKPTHFTKLSWVNLVLGVWLVAAPFVLSYDRLTTVQIGAPNIAFWNDIVLGLILILLAGASAKIAENAER